MPPVILTLPTGPKLETPLTVKLANVPREVIFGWSAVVIVPVKLEAIILSALTLPLVM